MPLADIRSRRWDVIVVGGGHNGLAAAAYLAGAGLEVLVLERRDTPGGACGAERPFSDQRFVVSPCAYVLGLLHPLVIEELRLSSRGLVVQTIDPHLWCPFEDGTSLTLWDDDAMSAESIAKLAPRDVQGYLDYCSLFRRVNNALRYGKRDIWVGEAPRREEIEELLGEDREALDLVFNDSIADVVERHVSDERIKTALHGQGLIGTRAGPRDPGTASIHLFHSSGMLEGLPGAWGYVRGGMGVVAAALSQAAEDAGAVIACGLEVARISPGEGVKLEGGELIRARSVVSNADPKRTMAMCEVAAPRWFSEKVDGWRSESPVLKINCALSKLPHFPADSAPARSGPSLAHRSMVTISEGMQSTQSAYEASLRGEPSPRWCELYFQSAYDTTVVPEGLHSMSVFAQYVPYTPSQGTWDERRDEIADAAMSEIARFAPEIIDVTIERQVLAPPDVQRRMGLTGGHIFHGDLLPAQMWDERFAPGTPIEGLYLCGAGTHPGGSVIGVNGRNAATKVLNDLAWTAGPTNSRG